LVTDQISYCTVSISPAALLFTIITISLLSTGLLVVHEYYYRNVLDAKRAKQEDIHDRLLLSAIDRRQKALLDAISTALQRSREDFLDALSTALQSSPSAEMNEEE